MYEETIIDFPLNTDNEVRHWTLSESGTIDEVNILSPVKGILKLNK